MRGYAFRGDYHLNNTCGRFCREMLVVRGYVWFGLGKIGGWDLIAESLWPMKHSEGLFTGICWFGLGKIGGWEIFPRVCGR